jgi:hypothetical protein
MKEISKMENFMGKEFWKINEEIGMRDNLWTTKRMGLEKKHLKMGIHI